ncbi:MAG: L-2-amino-thiazoline-4-carboxylic acid hydrolase [Anaerolineae bacterium]|nr:L-2-amino-thiazoline-4-carboxylic acid hydrolase [Anaerolineae bacterium]
MKRTTFLLSLALPALAARAVRTTIRSARVANAPPAATTFKLLYTPLIPRIANNILRGRYRDRHDLDKGRFTRTDVARILARAWRYYDIFAPVARVEQLETLGSIHNRLGGVLIHALYRALLDEGLPPDYATELASDMLWVVYDKMSSFPLAIARLLARDPQEQVNTTLRLFLRFPFNPPGYEATAVAGTDVFTLDIYRCPVYDYFHAQGEEAFMLNTFCKTDFALAQVMTQGGSYERPHTLAAGDNVCDMRWYARPRQLQPR